MEELMIVANVAIVFGVIYKLFELFAGRRERMMLIEKMGDKLTPETFKNGIIRNLVNCINVQITFVYKAYFGDLVVLTFSFTFADEI